MFEPVPKRIHTQNFCLDMVMPNRYKVLHWVKRLLAQSHNSVGKKIDIDWEFWIRLIQTLNLPSLFTTKEINIPQVLALD